MDKLGHTFFDYCDFCKRWRFFASFQTFEKKNKKFIFRTCQNCKAFKVKIIFKEVSEKPNGERNRKEK